VPIHGCARVGATADDIDIELDARRLRRRCRPGRQAVQPSFNKMAASVGAVMRLAVPAPVGLAPGRLTLAMPGAIRCQAAS